MCNLVGVGVQVQYAPIKRSFPVPSPVCCGADAASVYTYTDYSGAADGASEKARGGHVYIEKTRDPGQDWPRRDALTRATLGAGMMLLVQRHGDTLACGHFTFTVWRT